MVNGFRECKIGEIASVYSGGTPSTSVKEYWGGEIPWMNSGELNLKIVRAVEGRITELGMKSSSTHLIPNLCVLIGLAGQGKTRGTAAINTFPLCTNQSIAAIYPNDDFFDSFFLYYYMDTKYNELRDISSAGGGRGGLTKKLLSEFKVVIPESIAEQHRIAEVLSDIDCLIESTEKLIEKKKAIKQGVMQELLTGKRRLPGFSGEWETKTIKEMGFFYSGLSGKTKDDFNTGTAKYITFLNVLNNTCIDVSQLERVDIKQGESQHLVEKGDLFFNTSSETPEEVGMCSALICETRDTYLNSFCFGYRLTDKKVDPVYLSYYFNYSGEGRKKMLLLAQGSTRYNLSKSEFEKTVLLLPELKEQNAIVACLQDIDQCIDALIHKRLKLLDIKQGMMSKLLTGEIRI